MIGGRAGYPFKNDHKGREEADTNKLSSIEDLSWQCRKHVGDTLATCQKVAKFGSTCMSVPTQKVPRHKNFASEITDKL